MTDFHYETDFNLEDESKFLAWISNVCMSEGFALGDLNYIFCSDAYLLTINQSYLQHDDYTDIITFDYTVGKVLSGDIYISTERVSENSVSFEVSLQNELLRVMAHGLLHLMDYKDKEQEHIVVMRAKEDEKIKMFHVEQ
ncbi:rRNA maturation RNase YbeY [Maribacter antarcticus]|uniref:rRNA maturation RNase YbeY n=1 Tax=Maribacter antarcticus TaxID=505250 RepID=UPI00047CBA1F|nr:rRNA maturation RNase YbeY [Maribacter antarcticus]